MRAPCRAFLIAAAFACGPALAQDAVVDDNKPGSGADIAPTLKLRTQTDPSVRSDRSVYNEDEVWQRLGQEPPPSELMKRQRMLDADRKQSDELAPVRLGGSNRGSKQSTIATDGAADPNAKQLEEITVFGHPDESLYGDLHLSRIERSLPCLGCDRTPQPISKAVRIGGDVLLSLLRGFFGQPRVRGEPNDEAAYQINIGCGQDVMFRCQLP